MWELIIAGAAAIKVPALFEAGVRSVGERVLGPMLDNMVQPSKDRAQQRSRVAQAIGEIAAREVNSQPELFAIEVQQLLNQTGARAERTSSTFVKSLKYLPGVEHGQPTSSETPSDDWLNRWSRYVEDASSEELQEAFARILAGEIAKKGSFSVGTLRIVSELTMETAQEFSILWSEVIEDYAIKYPVYGRGESWKRLLHLREVGLVSASDASIHRPHASMTTIWSFGDGPFLRLEVDPSIYSEVPIINLTRLGKELGSILPEPDKIANLTRLALECPDRRGWKSATILTLTIASWREDCLWTAGASQ